MLRQNRLLFVGGEDGFVAIVSNEDFERLYRYDWVGVRRGTNCIYARAVIDGAATYLHREVMRAGPGQIVDHRYGCWFDCTKENLRIGNAQLNAANRGPSRSGCSTYKGVSRSGKRWQAQIQVGSHNKHLGRFADQESAARAYDRAARELNGEWAWQNFPGLC